MRAEPKSQTAAELLHQIGTFLGMADAAIKNEVRPHLAANLPLIVTSLRTTNDALASSIFLLDRANVDHTEFMAAYSAFTKARKKLEALITAKTKPGA